MGHSETQVSSWKIYCTNSEVIHATHLHLHYSIFNMFVFQSCSISVYPHFSLDRQNCLHETAIPGFALFFRVLPSWPSLSLFEGCLGNVQGIRCRASVAICQCISQNARWGRCRIYQAEAYILYHLVSCLVQGGISWSSRVSNSDYVLMAPLLMGQTQLRCTRTPISIHEWICLNTSHILYTLVYYIYTL